MKTYSYSGGIALLYQNKMEKYTFVEEIAFELENMILENEKLDKNDKIEIEL